jgi:hypothetical protein
MPRKSLKKISWGDLSFLPDVKSYMRSWVQKTYSKVTIIKIVTGFWIEKCTNETEYRVQR